MVPKSFQVYSFSLVRFAVLRCKMQMRHSPPSAGPLVFIVLPPTMNKPRALTKYREVMMTTTYRTRTADTVLLRIG